MSAKENFHFSKKIELRWADFDMQGHANNAVYMSYLEHARIHYLQQVCQWRMSEHALVLARAEIDYKLPILVDSKPLIFVRCERMGEKSFTLEYLITEETNPSKVFAVAKTVMVTLHAKNYESIPVPQEYRKRMESYEQN